jgi:hypothetical protein
VTRKGCCGETLSRLLERTGIDAALYGHDRPSAFYHRFAVEEARCKTGP